MEWRAGLDAFHWAHIDARDDTVWRFDGVTFTAESPPRERGDIRRLSAGRPTTFEAACRALGNWPGIEAIGAMAFPVKPTMEGPAQPSPSNQ
jgi:hypothetical protein